MTVQINTDKNIEWDQRHNEHFTGSINGELDRYSEHITRVEVHVSDENAGKKGVNDIRCLMEVRIEGKQPIAVTEQSNTIEQSVAGSITKVKAALKSILEH